MSIRYDELAIELKTSIGELTTLAEKLNESDGLNLPFAARAILNNEEAEVLRKAFREQPRQTPSLAPQLNPAPIRNTSDIQPTQSSDTLASQDETDSTESEMDVIHTNLEQALSAQETQDQELFESELATLEHHQFQLGVLQSIRGATANVKGFMAGQNALAAAKNARAVAALQRKAKMLAGTEGADFLPNYPSAAQSSTEIPEAPKSLTQQNFNSLDRLKKS